MKKKPDIDTSIPAVEVILYYLYFGPTVHKYDLPLSKHNSHQKKQ